MLGNARNARKCWNGRKVKSDAGKFFPDVCLSIIIGSTLLRSTAIVKGLILLLIE